MTSEKKEKKRFSFNSIYSQLLLIILAFAIMGVSSYIFVSDIERNHMAKYTGNILTYIEAEMASNLLEYETFLTSYSETIRNMVIRGETNESISLYMAAITNFLLKDRDRMEDLNNTYAYLFQEGGIFISGKNWIPPDDYIPQDQPWFILAVANEGRILSSDMYIDSITGNLILTFSRYITDYIGDPIGVICVDMALDNLKKYLIGINLTDNSYGFILNGNFEIISHPQSFYIGKNLNQVPGEISSFIPELKQGLNINERRAKNFNHDNSIIYIKKVKYDWYLGLIIPVNEYYKTVSNMAAFLIIIGCICAAALSIMFYNIYLAKLRTDLRTQQKSNFLATMSHEIRTPLNAILGMTEIQMQDTSHRPSTSEAFIKINNSGNLLLNIINDILDLSKIEAGKLELVPVKYEVANLINDITQLNYIRYESKPINFILNIDENIPSSLIGDDLRIKQILNNILSNAFKYTDSGEVVFSVNAECIGRGGAVLVTLIFTVSDTGQGMSSDQLNKLFDEYTRFNMEANRTTEGAGLGMTITLNLINLMYGKINVKSTVGEGTTVTVRIPQKTDGRGISGVLGKEMVENLCHFRHGGSMQQKKLMFTYEYMPYGHILIVDDVETNLYVAKGLMMPYGLDIDLAMSGFEVIDKIKQGKVYDIIFMDHMMPKMDGIETAKKIRKLGYTYPIVALTANALAGQAEIFLQNGFDGFISKPIDIRHLNLLLNRMIRDKQSSEVLDAAQKEKKELDKKLGIRKNPAQIDQQLAVIFSRDANKAVQILDECLNKNLKTENEIHSYIIHVHSMKSALANIGETELSAIALRLEQAGRDNNINVMLSETPGFIENLRMIIDKFQVKVENGKNEDTEENLSLLSEKIDIIKEACLSLDKKTAKTALNELLEKTWSSGIMELLNNISECLLHSEFDDAAVLIDAYNKEKP